MSNNNPVKLTPEELSRLRTMNVRYGGLGYGECEKLLAEVERLKAERPLVWRKEPPTEPGWYWWRKYPTWRADIVHVYRDARVDELVVRGWSVSLEKGEWFGPLPEPQEASE